MKPIAVLIVAFAVCIMSSCKNKSTTGSTTNDNDSTIVTNSVNVKTENVNIAADTTNMQCFVAYDENKQGARPIVLVVPEWWGLNDYPKTRAKQLAELGYFALAVDMFGNGSIAADPGQAKAFAGGFYNNPQLAAGRLAAALAKAKTYTQADSTKTAAIGYCFGGSMVLNAAKLGEPFDGVVSFHGSLAGVTPAKNTIKSEILVCHGSADSFIPPADVTNFKKTTGFGWREIHFQ